MTEQSERSLLQRGPFICTPDHAVDMAYFVSQLELAAEKGVEATYLGDIIHRYASNRLSVEEALVELQDFIDTFPKED